MISEQVTWSCKLSQPARSFPQLRYYESPTMTATGISDIQLRLEPNNNGKVHLGIFAPGGTNLQFAIVVYCVDNNGSMAECGTFLGAHNFQGSWICSPVTASVHMSTLNVMVAATFSRMRMIGQVNDSKRSESGDMDVSEDSGSRRKIRRRQDDMDVCGDNSESYSSPDVGPFSSPEVEMLRQDMEHVLS